jgi:hypothetical protein
LLLTLPAAFRPALATVPLRARLTTIAPRAAFAALALAHLDLDTLWDRSRFFGGRHLATLARLFLCERGGKGSRCQQCSKGECLFHDYRSVERACTIVAASHVPLVAESG